MTTKKWRVVAVLMCFLTISGLLSSCQKTKSGQEEGALSNSFSTDDIASSSLDESWDTLRFPEKVDLSNYDSFELTELVTPNKENEFLLESVLHEGMIYAVCESTNNDSLEMYVSIFGDCGNYVKSFALPQMDLFFYSIQSLADGTLLFVYCKQNEIVIGSEQEIEYMFGLVNTDIQGKIITSFTSESLPFSHTYPRVVVNEKNELFVSTMTTLYVLGMDGKVKAKIKDEMFTGSIFRANGGVYGYYMDQLLFDEDSQFLHKIDVEKGIISKDDTISLALSLDVNKLIVIDNQYFSSDNNGIIQYDLSGNTFTDVLSWGRSGMPQSDSIVFRILRKDIIIVYYTTPDERQGIALITKNESENVRVFITIGTVFSGGITDISDVIDRLNKANDHITYVLKDYTALAETKTEAGYDGDEISAAIKMMNLDILSGKGPDILVDRGFLPMRVYEKQGLLIDLGNYLSGEEYGTDQYYHNALFAFQNADKSVYQIPTQFSVVGMAVPVGVALENVNGWTITEFDEWCNKVSKEGRPAFKSFEEKIYAVGNFVRFDAGNYIDYGSQKASFQKQDFYDLLSFVNKYSEVEGNYEDTLVHEAWISNITDYCRHASYMKSMITLLGYPSANANAPAISIPYTLSVMSSSIDKALAWDFIEECLTEEGQSEMLIQESQYLPVSKNALHDYLAKILEDDPEMKKNIETFHWFYRDGETVLPTMEERDAFLNIIDRAQFYPAMSYQLTDIITEELQPFFEGQKSSEMVAEIIENRLQTWLNEQS